MEKKSKPEITKTKPINIMLQEDLIKRINAFCVEQEITIHEFVTDAIVEKLNLVYKERRKKGRM
ncbi:MAG TPA: hypothetical protein DCY53_07805 [Desulfobacteraceae bacterium]|nr:hypothetical protein [Desulfobacteraceae bacterium]